MFPGQLLVIITVKPALVTTCIEGPPVYKDHIFLFLLKIVSH